MSRLQRVTIVFAVLATASAVVAIAAALASQPQPASALLTFVFAVAIGGLTAALGVLVSRHRPDNLVGSLLAALGLTFVVMGGGQVVLQAVANSGISSPAALWAVALTREFAVWAIAAFALLLLFFPDGDFPGSRWRWVPALLIPGALIFELLGAVDPTPYPSPLQDLSRIGAETFPQLASVARDFLEPLLLLAILALAFACIGSLF